MTTTSDSKTSGGMPPHPELFINHDIFPEMEGIQYEFKRDINKFVPKKAYQTICGFLNCEGGYMVFGIDDKTREIVGITKCDQIDKFILLIDNVYQQKSVVSRTTKEPPPIGAVVCKAYNSATGKTIVVITVNKVDDEEYQMFDGSLVYRANASNYVVKAERVYSEHEYKQGIRLVEQKHAKMVRKMVQDMNLENKQKRDFENEKRVYEELLAAKILQEKTNKESQLQLHRHNGYDLSNSLFGCFVRFLSV